MRDAATIPALVIDVTIVARLQVGMTILRRYNTQLHGSHQYHTAAVRLPRAAYPLTGDRLQTKSSMLAGRPTLPSICIKLGWLHRASAKRKLMPTGRSDGPAWYGQSVDAD